MTKRVLLFAFWILGIAEYAAGQEALSLAQAIELGMSNNYDITIVKKNVEAAENMNNQGQAGRYPSLTLNLTQPNNWSDQIKTASPFQAQGVIGSNAITPSINLNWVLFEGFKVNISKNRYEKLQMESEGNASIVVSNTVQAIVMGYYLTSLEKERLDVFEKSLKLSRDRYNYVKLKRNYGSAVTTDLLLEEGNYLTDSVNFINQQLAFRSAVRTLNQLLAVSDLDRTYNLTDTIGEMLETYNLEDLEKKMLENNSDLKTKYLAQSIVKYDLKLARSEMYPKVSLNASASNNWSQIDQSKAEFYNFSTQTFTPGPTEVLPSENRSYAINFSLTYNLFNGRKINTAIKNAAIREDIGEIEIEKMTISLRKDLYSDLDNYQIRRQIYEINKRKLKAAELNVDISKDKFKMGSINSFDYRTVQINYLTAALQELNSRYGLLESKISLMRLTGTILEVYQ